MFWHFSEGICLNTCSVETQDIFNSMLKFSFKLMQFITCVYILIHFSLLAVLKSQRRPANVAAGSITTYCRVFQCGKVNVGEQYTYMVTISCSQLDFLLRTCTTSFLSFRKLMKAPPSLLSSVTVGEKATS